MPQSGHLVGHARLRRHWSAVRSSPSSAGTAATASSASQGPRSVAARSARRPLSALGARRPASTGHAVDRSVLGLPAGEGPARETGVVDQRTWDRLRALTSTPTAIRRTAPAAQVREVQLRLRALGLWPYAITGVYWSALDRAVLAFQQSRNLPQSGVVDRARGPGSSPRPTARAPSTPTATTPGCAPVLPTLGVARRPLPHRPGHVRRQGDPHPDLGRQRQAPDGHVGPLRRARERRPARAPSACLRKYEYVISNLYFTPMPYSMFFSGGQAVHYSSNFARLGYASASHGCVNIADHAQVKALFFAGAHRRQGRRLPLSPAVRGTTTRSKGWTPLTRA